MDIFREEKLELLELTGTKLKRKREVLWCGINGIMFKRWKELWKV